MIVCRAISELRAWRGGAAGGVGLVPTMGSLHEGHRSLVQAARRECEQVVVSIFVNPAQFAPHEDFASYPRDEHRDLKLLESNGVDAVFAPSADEMYASDFSTYVAVEGLTDRLEGLSRPSHFRGVTTVVLKLLNIVQPERAYFGRKDAQQLAVVRRMVRDLNVPVDIIGLPIVREPDGLAMSSRNVYLSAQQRNSALVLSRSLRAAEDAYAAGERSAVAIRELMRARLLDEPLAEVEYVSVADAETLEELEHVDRQALVSLAVRFGETRLIDNCSLA